jgi:DNA-directed RNA polymerase specialized sigma subunit
MDVVDELEKEFGRSLTAKELAQLLRIDSRTVNRYASRWGGVEVSPNRYRFFEKSIKQVFSHAYNHRETGQAALHQPNNGERRKEIQTVPRHQQGIKTSRHAVGTRDQKASRAGIDRHQMFVDHRLNQ